MSISSFNAPILPAVDSIFPIPLQRGGVEGKWAKEEVSNANALTSHLKPCSAASQWLSCSSGLYPVELFLLNPVQMWEESCDSSLRNKNIYLRINGLLFLRNRDFLLLIETYKCLKGFF